MDVHGLCRFVSTICIVSWLFVNLRLIQCTTTIKLIRFLMVFRIYRVYGVCCAYISTNQVPLGSGSGMPSMHAKEKKTKQKIMKPNCVREDEKQIVNYFREKPLKISFWIWQCAMCILQFCNCSHLC